MFDEKKDECVLARRCLQNQRECFQTHWREPLAPILSLHYFSTFSTKS